MRPIGKALIGLGLAASFVAGVVAVAAATADESENARAQKLSHLVRQDCGACHGMTLKGGLGRPLLPERLGEIDASALAGIILDGIPGTPMPPWRGILSEADALWIARALKQGTIQ